MRRGCNSKIIEINGEFIGINLGADYCCEHECGISGIIKNFSIEIDKHNKSLGVIKSLPSSYEKLNIMDIEFRNEKFLALYCDFLYGDFDNPMELINMWELNSYSFNEDGYSTSWDEDSFAILVKEKYREQLNELYNAFQKLDITFSMQRENNNPYSRPGLKILITSKYKKHPDLV